MRRGVGKPSLGGVARERQIFRPAVAGAICQSWFLYPQRENFRLTPEVKEKFTGKLEQNPRDFFGRKVKEVVRSGTEPVVRVYSEAGSADPLAKLRAAAKQWIFE